MECQSPSLAESNRLDLRALRMLAPRTRIVGEGLIQRAEIKTDRTGQPYASLTICCVDGGRLEARWWRYPYPADQCPVVWAVYRFAGQVEVFQGCVQLRIADVVPAPEADLSSFVRTSRRSLAELEADFQSLVADLDSDLAALVREVLAGEVYECFRTWPAAPAGWGRSCHRVPAACAG